MCPEYTEEEVAEIEADCAWWKSLIKHPDYFLIGFTYRDVATFGIRGRDERCIGTVEVTQHHIKLLASRE